MLRYGLLYCRRAEEAFPLSSSVILRIIACMQAASQVGSLGGSSHWRLLGRCFWPQVKSMKALQHLCIRGSHRKHTLGSPSPRSPRSWMQQLSPIARHLATGLLSEPACGSMLRSGRLSFPLKCVRSDRVKAVSWFQLWANPHGIVLGNCARAV